jgi:hypothetical protein
VLLRSLRTMCSPNPIYGHGLRANVTTWLMERLCSPERLRDPRLQMQTKGRLEGIYDTESLVRPGLQIQMKMAEATAAPEES